MNCIYPVSITSVAGYDLSYMFADLHKRHVSINNRFLHWLIGMSEFEFPTSFKRHSFRQISWTVDDGETRTFTATAIFDPCDRCVFVGPLSSPVSAAITVWFADNVNNRGILNAQSSSGHVYYSHAYFGPLDPVILTTEFLRDEVDSSSTFECIVVPNMQGHCEAVRLGVLDSTIGHDRLMFYNLLQVMSNCEGDGPRDGEMPDYVHPMSVIVPQARGVVERRKRAYGGPGADCFLGVE